MDTPIDSVPGLVTVTQTFDGRQYLVTLVHHGLGKSQVFSGRTQQIALERAKAKQREWDHKWREQLAKAAAAHARKEQLQAQVREREEREAEAKALDGRAAAALASLKSILADAVANPFSFDWESLKDTRPFPKPRPQLRQVPPPVEPPPPTAPSRSDPRYQPQLTAADRLIPSLRRRKQEEVDALYAADCRAWQAQIQDHQKRISSMRRAHLEAVRQSQAEFEAATRQWEAERAAFLAAQTRQNQSVGRERDLYRSADPGAIERYCLRVVSAPRPPRNLTLTGHKVKYDASNHVLVVDAALPRPEDLPSVKGVRYVRSRDAIEEIPLPDAARNQLYDSVLYQIALRMLLDLYASDELGALALVVLNGWVSSIDRATGRRAHACVLSVQATREQISGIDLARVDPKACFKKLRGVAAATLVGLTPVPPLLQLDTTDPRFVASHAVASTLNEGTNLAAMDWQEFEHLIREVFEGEFGATGGEVKVTRASRDSGVDAVAFDPDPIRGGKIIIQAKRYTDTVDVSAVRDLYGTVLNEGATKGILVTTSDYGPDAYAFAAGKPITLLNGSHLLGLLERRGHKAHIDLQAAKKLQAGE